MIRITLPSDLEQAIERRAQECGTPPERFVVDDLRLRYLPETSPSEHSLHPGTLADYLGDFVGSVDSHDVFPEGSPLSDRAGEEFANMMLEKHRQGKL
jgi:hypothetical protein